MMPLLRTWPLCSMWRSNPFPNPHRPKQPVPCCPASISARPEHDSLLTQSVTLTQGPFTPGLLIGGLMYAAMMSRRNDHWERYHDQTGAVFFFLSQPTRVSTQCWFNVGPPSETLAQHRTRIVSASGVCWGC